MDRPLPQVVRHDHLVVSERPSAILYDAATDRPRTTKMWPVKTFLWALLMAGAWFIWFMMEALLVEPIGRPVLDSTELRLIGPHLVASALAGLVPAVALRARARRLGVPMPGWTIPLLMVLSAPIGPVIHVLLPRANWFFTALGLAVYIGVSQALVLRRFARGAFSFVLGATIGVFVATLIAGGDIWDITFLPLATLGLGAGQAWATLSLRPIPGAGASPE